MLDDHVFSVPVDIFPGLNCDLRDEGNVSRIMLDAGGPTRVRGRNPALIADELRLVNWRAEKGASAF